MEAKQIHKESIVIDGCSFFAKGWSERMQTAGVTALQMTVPWPDDRAIEAIKRYREYYDLVAADDRLMIIETAADIERCHAQGKIGFILGSQNGRIVQDDPDLVKVFQLVGVRVIQLTYNHRNLLGDGCLEPTNSGLSRLGKRVVQEMNSAGITVDLTHVGERSSLDALQASTKPCLFSHSNPKARVDNPRNITDEQIKLCADAGGVIGLCPWPPICWPGGDQPPTLADFIGHVEYVVDLVGIDHVSLGTDSEATIGAYPPELATGLASPDVKRKLSAAFPDVKSTVGLESMEKLPDLTAALLDRGWKVDDVKALLGRNLMRVYAATWEGA